MHADRAWQSMPGTFSTPYVGAQWWSLSAAVMHASRGGHSRRGIFSTPYGVAQGVVSEGRRCARRSCTA
eukprot:395471-Pyramimonas_sp.AAC.1